MDLSKKKRTGLTALRLLVVLLAAAALRPGAASGQERGAYALLIGGLGGTPAYTETFSGYLLETRRALVERHGFAAEDVTVLAERAVADWVDGPSTAEEIRARFAELAARGGADAHVFIVLFGHGSYDGEHAALNIPRRDLRDADYAELVDGLGAARVVFVNTASASGPFAAVVSGPDRVVVTATRAGTQRNETVFPRYFVEALGAPSADLDRDGRLSVREAFDYAAAQTAASFDAQGTLATEQALLEDTGDGEAHRAEALDAAGEGALAGVTYFARRAAADGPGGTLLAEREAVEREVAETKARKAAMDEDAYYAQLETLFVRLARLNARLDADDPAP